MTTLLLARLVDAGKVRWDTPVVELFPAFRLGDAETTRPLIVIPGLTRNPVFLIWITIYMGMTLWN